jgi:hypothetical protein
MSCNVKSTLKNAVVLAVFYYGINQDMVYNIL